MSVSDGSVLLDASVVIALLSPEHEHYDRAESWFAAHVGRFATCPITQGAVVRYALRSGRSAQGALHSLRSLVGHKRHEFWHDDVDYLQVRFDGVVGHRQVTGAYLAQLARQHGGRLATFDHGLAAAHPDVADLVPAAG